MSAVPAQPAVESVAVPYAFARRLALPLVFVVATVYHFLQSRGHATPTVFNDEMLYAKLSQSIAAGHGLSIRGEHFFFPAPLAPLVQAPAWLLSSMTDAYAAAKLINAAVMSSAVFPAYWLARRVVRPSYALVTAAATVATPAIVYHGYLMSEALAYPVFLCAVAILAREAATPSRWTAVIVPLTCAFAIATRVQFLVLPLAYLAAAAFDLRRRLLPVALTGLLVAVLVVVPGALGQYGEATHLGYAPGNVAHWALTTGYLLPFAVGLAIVPGAVFGLSLMLVRARHRFERAVAVFTVASTALFLGQAALIAAGEAHRPLERYTFYVAPLLFIAFFAYVERGAPGRLAYILFSCVGAVALSLVSFPSLTGTAAFFFDAFTLSGFARVASEIGLDNASLVYSLVPLAAAAIALLVRRAPMAVALTAVALAVAGGAGVYATDRLATSFSARTFNAPPPDWLDRSGLGDATYLVLPNSEYFVGTSLESWNRDIRHVAVLGAPAPDPFPTQVARVSRDGELHVGGARTVVVNIAGSRIALDGRVVARPRKDLVAYRLPATSHVRWLADGLASDGWTSRTLRYRSWPIRPGRYELTLWLPRGEKERIVTLPGGRKFTLTAGHPRHLSIPTRGEPLLLDIDASHAPFYGRYLGAKVSGLRFRP
jgi:hypothetical protein